MPEKNNSAKSFFERLTGSLKVEESADEETTTVKAKRVDFNSDGERKEKEVSVEVEHEEETPAPAAAPAPEKEQGSWLNEAQEGQLTIDVYQTEDEIVIKSTVAGVKPEDLDIAITNDMVTIRGRREKDENVPSQNYYYQECYWGPFSRSVILPMDVAADRSEATLKNGILTLRLPKIEKEQTKKIKVKLAS